MLFPMICMVLAGVFGGFVVGVIAGAVAADHDRRRNVVVSNVDFDPTIS